MMVIATIEVESALYIAAGFTLTYLCLELAWDFTACKIKDETILKQCLFKESRKQVLLKRNRLWGWTLLELNDCICDRIQKVDRSIRYVGIANKMGTRIEDHYRKGLDPLLNENELDLSALESTLRMNLRRDMHYRLGRALYSFTLYEKVKRVTIPLYDSGYQILMISFDIDGKNEYIILEKVLSLLENVNM
jgi:hypothetical protein